jgi:hypothetical protein
MGVKHSGRRSSKIANEVSNRIGFQMKNDIFYHQNVPGASKQYWRSAGLTYFNANFSSFGGDALICVNENQMAFR